MSEQRHHERIESFRTSSANMYVTLEVISRIGTTNAMISHLATTISVPLRRILGAWGRDNINFWIINYNIPSSPQNYSERIQYLGLCSGKNTAITVSNVFAPDAALKCYFTIQLVNEGTDEINMIREIETHFGIQMVSSGQNITTIITPSKKAELRWEGDTLR
ncbi:hypothetical protein B0J17DRAFT_641268 [Rhizoctonia solani]|nr:hypothetical protein B0J17DRAFT_641268 [Rhizoctonia solani]